MNTMPKKVSFQIFKKNLLSKKYIVLLILLWQTWAVSFTAAREAGDLSLLHFKRAIDSDNIRLVVKWFKNDLRNDSELNSLAARLAEVEDDIYNCIPATFKAISYENLIVTQLIPKQQSDAGKELRIRKLIRHSVDYLNLSPSPEILALKRAEFYQPADQSHTERSAFEIKRGFTPDIKGLDPETPHTIIDLQNYVHQRLGRVPVSQAILSDWPLHIFDSPAPVALTFLKKGGYREFYRVNNFYSQWGKKIYLAKDDNRMALVFTDVFGEFMLKHISYMLKLARVDGKGFEPEKITYYFNRKITAKEEIVKKYQRDIPRIFKKKKTAVILGYLDILGESIHKRHQAFQAFRFFKDYLTPREKKELEAALSKHGGKRLREAFHSIIEGHKHLLSMKDIRASEYHDLMAILKRHREDYPFLRRLNRYLMAKGIPSIHERGKGEALEYDVFTFRNSKGDVRHLVNLGAMHSLFGDIAAELAEITLKNGVKELVFSGSAGALRTDFPYYALVIPKIIRDYRGAVMANNNDNRFKLSASFLKRDDAARVFAGTVHQGVLSPLTETQPTVLAMITDGVDTVDVELAEVVRMVKRHPGATFASALIVTDFPGAFLRKNNYHLDQVDYGKKYEIIPALVDLIFNYLDVEEVLYFDDDD